MLNVEQEEVPKESTPSAEAPQEQAPPPEKVAIPEIKPVEVPKMGSFGALVLMATILTIAGAGILYFMTLSKGKSIEQKNTEFTNLQTMLNEGQLGQLNKDLGEIVTGQTALDNALKSRIYWSKFWNELNNATPKTVAYTTMTVDKAGSVAVSGTAADFSAVAKLMVSLQHAPIFSTVELAGTSVKEEGGKKQTVFSLKLQVNPEKLK